MPQTGTADETTISARLQPSQLHLELCAPQRVGLRLRRRSRSRSSGDACAVCGQSKCSGVWTIQMQ
eukprot:1746546-Pleurochrysis_carterae.AAC.1